MTKKKSTGKTELIRRIKKYNENYHGERKLSEGSADYFAKIVVEDPSRQEGYGGKKKGIEAFADFLVKENPKITCSRAWEEAEQYTSHMPWCGDGSYRVYRDGERLFDEDAGGKGIARASFGRFLTDAKKRSAQKSQ